MDIYELAENLAQEIEDSGKTRWSAKDVKDFFLSEGINLSLDEILQVWDACPSPVCACELLGCDAIMADEDIVGDYEILDVHLGDVGSDDTFYMEAQTQYDIITISAARHPFGRYDAVYELYSEENGELASGTLRNVLAVFFDTYEVSKDFRREIKPTASEY